MRTVRILALSAAMLGLAAKVHADPVPVAAGTVVQAPAWTPGAEWHYSDGYGLKVSSSSPGGTVFERLDAPGQWFSRLGFIRTDSLTAGTARNAIYRTVPDNAGFALSAGKPLTFQREYLSGGKLLVHASSWTVEGRETITVPAGTFDCWIIVWRTRSLRSDWTGFERWWYSPQAQHYVRLEYQYGQDNSGSRVLMRYKPAAAALVPSSAPSSTPDAPQPGRNTVQKEIKPQDAVAKDRMAAPIAVAPAKAAELQPVARPVPAPVVPPVAPSVANGIWHVQIGSSQQEALLRAGLKKIVTKNASLKALPSGVRMHQGPQGEKLYRAWLGSYDNAQSAKALCRTLKASGTECFVSKKDDGLERQQLAQNRG